MNRRQFLQRAAITTGTGIVAVGAWQFELHHLEVVKVTMPIANLPTSLEGARLVQVSDLHVGSQVSDTYIRHALALAGSLKPDILAYTGDFVTWRGESQRTQLDSVLEAAPRGRLATVGVLGNHDYGRGWREPSVADSVVTVTKKHGIDIIRNGARIVEGLSIIGIDDWWAGMANVATARSMVADTTPALVLCHNPDVADLPVWRGYRGWMLAGHTHGGQCRAPFCAPPVLPVQNKNYAAGKVETADGRTVYINRGAGHTLPIRVLVRPEITCFTLVRA